MNADNGLKRSDYSNEEDYLRDLRAFGFDVVDGFGRHTVAAVGNGPQARMVKAMNGAPKRRPASTSEGLTARQFNRLYEAVLFANCQAVVLNTMVTIAWSTFGLGHEVSVNKAHEAFLILFRHWCRDQRKVPHAVIWVKERGKVLGLHSHLLVHVPPPFRREFYRWALRTVRSVAKGAETKLAFEANGPRTLHIGENHADNVDAQWRMFRYLAKGVGPEELVGLVSKEHRGLLLSEFAGLRASGQGEIIGKRAGWSTSLGEAAIARFSREEGLPLEFNDPSPGQNLYTDGALRWGRQLAKDRLMDAHLRTLDI